MYSISKLHLKDDEVDTISDAGFLVAELQL